MKSIKSLYKNRTLLKLKKIQIRNKKNQILKLYNSHSNENTNKSNKNKNNFKLKTPINNKRYSLVFKVR